MVFVVDGDCNDFCFYCCVTSHVKMYWLELQWFVILHDSEGVPLLAVLALLVWEF